MTRRPSTPSCRKPAHTHLVEVDVGDGVVHDFGLKGVELLGARELAVDEEVGAFEEIALF